MTALAAARELRSFLRSQGSRSAGAAAAALDGLRRVVPADCMALSVWDPVAGAHHTLASSYPTTATVLLDECFHTDRLFTAARAGRRPVRVRDIDPRERHGQIFERIIVPHGFRDGVTQCLYAADGRYVGMLGASSIDGRDPDDDTVELLDLLGPDLGRAIDPAPIDPTHTASLAAGTTDGMLVRHDGHIVGLSGAARPELLAPPSPLADVVDAVLAGSAVPGRFLHLTSPGDVIEIEMHSALTGVVVLHRAVPPPAGLTVRELQVLEAMGLGLSNPEIGARLGIRTRTVATHVEHILAKTDSRNRLSAARRAARWGLLITGGE